MRSFIIGFVTLVVSSAFAQISDLQYLAEVSIKSFISQKFDGYEYLQARKIQFVKADRNSQGQLTKLYVTAEVSDLIADRYQDPEREYNQNYRMKTCTMEIVVDFAKKTAFGYDLDFFNPKNCRETPFKKQD